MASKAGKVHLLGVAITIVVAIVLLFTLFPHLVRLVFPPPYKPLLGIRLEPYYYLTAALIPVVLWLIPPLLRSLARGTYRAHRALLGKSGFYVRFPTKREIRFRDTVLMALGPFAVDLLVIAELDYLFNAQDARLLSRGLVAVPILMILVGLLTTLVPGPWLLDALDIRLVNPSRGEVVRAAELFERLLGPIGAIALLASFLTTLHEVNYSYEQGLVSLGEWAVRLFPPVLAAVSVYRVIVEPDVLPSLERWCEQEEIPVRATLDDTLAGLKDSVVPGGGSDERPHPEGSADPPK